MDKNVNRFYAYRCYSVVFISIVMFRSCAAPYHSGMSCEFYQIYKSDDDHSLKVRNRCSLLVASSVANPEDF
jgi:hypothetical protein